MIARSHIDEDLQLKQFARSGADTKPRFDWTPQNLSGTATPAAIPVSTAAGESRIYTTGDIATMIGDALTDLMLSRQEQEIFTEKNRRLVTQIATLVSTDLTARTRGTGEEERTTVSANDITRLIERALVRNNAYDLARSIITRHQTADGRDGNDNDSFMLTNAAPTCRVIRRNGHVVNWNQNKIEIAIRKAFLSEQMDAEPAVEIARLLSIRLRDEGRQMIHIEELQEIGRAHV